MFFGKKDRDVRLTDKQYKLRLLRPRQRVGILSG